MSDLEHACEHSANSTDMDKVCFLCGGKALRESADKPKLEVNLEVIFIARELLKIPGYLCAIYLQKYGNPSKWGLHLCHSCVAIVQQGRELFGKIAELEKLLENIRTRVQCGLKVKRELPSEWGQLHIAEVGAVQEIREFCCSDSHCENDASCLTEFEITPDVEAVQSVEVDRAEFNDVKQEEVEVGGQKKRGRGHPRKNSLGVRRDVKSQKGTEKGGRGRPKTKISEDASSTGDVIKIENLNSEHGTSDGVDTDNYFSSDGYESDGDDVSMAKKRKHSKDNSNNKRKRRKSRKKKGEEQTEFPCSDPNCSETFDKRCDRRAHYNSCHTIGIPCLEPSCGRILSTYGILENHLRRWHTPQSALVCNGCSKTYKQTVHYKSHLKDSSVCVAAAFKCTQCTVLAGSEVALNLHIKVHHNTPVHFPFKCETCGKLFKEKFKLNYHMQIHTTEKPFVCEVCGACFILEYYLKNHQQDVHLSKEPGAASYGCSVCGKTFPTRGSRGKHEMTHREDRPWLCTVCGSSFKVKEYLNTHMWRTHDPDKKRKKRQSKLTQQSTSSSTNDNSRGSGSGDRDTDHPMIPTSQSTVSSSECGWDPRNNNIKSNFNGNDNNYQYF